MVAIAAAVLVAVPSFALPASAEPPVVDGTVSDSITVSVDNANALAGGTALLTLNATNNTSPSIDLFNASAVVVLPVGVEYVPGTTSGPRGIGEPEVRTWYPDPENLAITAVALVWPNVADIPVGASLDISFGVTADDDLHPVGSVFDVDAGVYANSDERLVPRVTIPESGPPVIRRATDGGSDAATVTIVPVRVEKENHDAENEVYRGEANSTTYSITLTPDELFGSGELTVVDYVPAAFQVIECTECTSQEIVELGDEVVTKLTWVLPALEAGAANAKTFTYTAFVGLNEITAPDGDANGAATRPGPTGRGLTNTVEVTGTYQGETVDGDPAFSIETSESVNLLDLGIVKSGVEEFEAGTIATYGFVVRSSQYVTASGITVTDTIPNGMCPVVPVGAVIEGSWPTDCPQPGGEGTEGSVTGATITRAVANADGTFTVEFELESPVAVDLQHSVSYQVFQRSQYENGAKTSAADSFTNRVVVSGTTSPADGNDVDEGERVPENGSAATSEARGVDLSKAVWINVDRDLISLSGGTDPATSTTCGTADADEWFTGDESPAADVPSYQLGDLVCFRITIDFPSSISTRDAVITDFLPESTELVGWSYGPGNDVTAERDGSSDRWLLGTKTAGHHFVPAGATLELDLVARVIDVDSTDVDLTGNLVKLRYLDGEGTVVAARDDVAIALKPAVPLVTEKTADPEQVVEGEMVTYAVKVTHSGNAADQTDSPLNWLEVWDRLPAGFTCGDLSPDFVVFPSEGGILSSSSAACSEGTSPATSGYSVITWPLTGAHLGTDDEFTAGETLTLVYTLKVPSPLSVGSEHTNTASVVAYTSSTTDGTASPAPNAEYFPEDSLDNRTETADKWNAPNANDTATITLPGATVDKEIVTTSHTSTGNNASSQATIGETITYEYSVTIPKNTSVFRGRLADVFSSNHAGRVTVTSVSAAVAGGPAATTMPTSTTGTCPSAGSAAHATDFVLCADGTLVFPNTWTNSSGSDAVFTVTLTARVNDVSSPANGHNSLIRNRGVFSYAPGSNGGTRATTQTGNVDARVVEPSPQLTKSVGPSQNVTGGQEVTFTLIASNPNTGNPSPRPPAYGTEVTDCVPAEFTNVTLVGDPAATVEAGACTPADGPSDSGTLVTWTIGDVAGGATNTLQYTATITSAAVAGDSYTNDAELTAASLPATHTDQTSVRKYTRPADATVNIAPVTTSKEADRDSAVPGESITWTVTVTIPRNVNAYDFAIQDVLPAGVSAPTTATITCSWGDCPDGHGLLAQDDQTIAYLVGDLAASSDERTVTLTYATTVIAEGSTPAAGTALTNSARARWNDSADDAPPINAGGPWDHGSTHDTDSVLVKEPQVAIAKKVDGADSAEVGPAQVLTYSVTASASTTSPHNVPAHNVRVVDTVPSGIVVNEVSISNGGTWDSSARTITWTLTGLAPGMPVTFTYSASLAPSSEIGLASPAQNGYGADQVNTVRVPSWASLPEDGRDYAPATPPQDTASVTPRFPYVTVVKGQDPTVNPVYRGDEVPFSLTITNSGGAVATTIDITDELPENWTYKTGSATLQGDPASDPAVSGQVLEWESLGGEINLAAGESVTLRYIAIPSENAATGNHVNEASASEVTDEAGGTSFADGEGSYTGPADTASAYIANADLTISKSPVASTLVEGAAVAGQQAAWDVTVTNLGPDTSVGVTVTEDLSALPADVTIVSVDGEGWTCAPVGESRIYECILDAGALATDAESAFRVTVSIPADHEVSAESTLENSVSVSARTIDTNPSNNDASSEVPIVALADVGLVKTGPATVVAGEAISWEITATNHGPSVSRGSSGSPIVITDTIPSGVSITGATSADAAVSCEVDGQEVTCEIARDLAVNDSVAVLISGTVAPDVTTVLTNDAAVSPVTPEGENAQPNQDEVSTTVDIREALTISKTVLDPAPPEGVAAGETVRYQIDVANGGPSVARNVFVVDDLPEGTSFVGIASGTSDGWSVRSSSAGTVTFDYAPVLGVSASAAPLVIDVLVDHETTAETLMNDVLVGSPWDENQDDDSATIGNDVQADLGIVKTFAEDSVIAGTATSFTLAVTNHGSSTTQGPITVTDELPAGMTVNESIPGCSVSTGEGGVETLSCTREGSLAPTGTWTITVPVLIAADTQTTLSNTASVAGPEGEDPNPGNDTSTDTIVVNTRADVTVSKTALDDDAPVVAGTDVTWRIVVGNNGPSDAQNVSLSDALDERLTLVSVNAPDGVECSGETTLTCSLGTVAPHQEVVIEITTTVKSWVPRPGVEGDDEIGNTVFVSSTTLDVDGQGPSSDDDSDEITVISEAELALVKSPEEQTVDAGGLASFGLELTNDGPSDAQAPVTITDVLPGGLTYFSASTGDGAYTWYCEAGELGAAGQEVTCVLRDVEDDPASLAAGTTAPVLNLYANVAPDLQESQLTNVASADSGSSPETTSNEVVINVITRADLAVTKTHDPSATAVAGEEFTWSIGVVNNGPSVSRGSEENPIQIVDSLPEGAQFVDANVPDGVTWSLSDDERTVTYAIEHDLVPEQLVEFEIVLLLGSDLVEVTNVVEIDVESLTTPEPEVDASDGNNRATDTVGVTWVADLGISKTVSPDQGDVVAGEPITWQIQVTNYGPSTSGASEENPITVSDPLPESVDPETVTVLADGWEYEIADGVVTFTRITDLPVGEAGLIELTGVVASSATGELSNTATVSPGETPQPPEGEPDTDTEIVPVLTSADLAITKVISETLEAGRTGAYTLQVVNLGPSDAVDVRITDELPEGLTFSSADGEGWTCEQGVVAVECVLDGPLPAGGVTEVTLNVDVASEITGEITNTAEVTSETPDPVEENNTDTATGLVAELVDLAVSKSHDGPVAIGGEVTFTLEVTNAGPALARGVVLTDVMPDGLDVVSVTADEWLCVDAEGAITCLLPELAAGASAPSVTVVATVTAGAYPSVLNVAEVTSASPEENLDDNLASDEVIVPPVSDVSIVKELTAPLVAGRTGTYTFTVTNTGPTEEPGVVRITDELPAGLALRDWSVTGTILVEGAELNESDGVLEFSFMGLPVGESVTFTAVVDVAASLNGEVVNTAVVTAENDPEPGSDSARGEVDTSRIPPTGANVAWTIVAALGLLGLGALAVRVARKRVK